MAQGASRRPLTAEARFRFRGNLCETRGGQRGTGTVLPLSVFYDHCSTLIFIFMLLLPEGPTGEAWEPSKKQVYFGIR
jgi:hypothetical protein